MLLPLGESEHLERGRPPVMLSSKMRGPADAKLCSVSRDKHKQQQATEGYTGKHVRFAPMYVRRRGTGAL